MATTDELIALGGRQVGIVVLFDGCEVGLTDNAALAGIDTGAGHVVRAGLLREGLSCDLGVNLRDGTWQNSPASIPILDLDGDLAALFAAVATDEQSLGDVPIGSGTPVGPLSDLTGRPELDEMNIGLERIGANGARHQFAVPPGFDVGLDHTVTTPALNISGAPVTSSPIVWIGRRCSIYLCFRDHVTYPDRSVGASAWRPFSEAKRIWCGTLKDQGDVSGRRWSFDGEGPGSLLKKSLATSFSPDPVRCSGDVTLSSTVGESEVGIYITLSVGLIEYYGVRNFTTDITGTTTDAIRDEVIAEIVAAAAATGVDGEWVDQAGYSVAMTQDGGISISVLNTTLGEGELYLVLHRKVWSILGYDVEAQASMYPDAEDPRAVNFHAFSVEAGAPGPDYFGGVFVTGGAWAEAGDNNGGVPRNYRPLYMGGTSILLAGLNNGAGQIVRLGDNLLGGGATSTSVAHPGQFAWPVASDPLDPTAPIEISGTPCDRSGWFLFSGKRRFLGVGGSAAEVFDERWIGLANWVNGTGAQDGLISGDTIIVTHWMDPSLYGYRTKSSQLGIDQDWIARDEANPDEGQIQATPLVMLGYSTAPDLAHLVIQRLLHTTGTCTGWDAPELDSPAIVGGDNEPAGAHQPQRDAEIADLGLAIPDEWIASPAAFAAEAARVENDAILDVKVAFTAGYQADDVLRSLMQPVGWSWHFRDGQLGVWCPGDPLTLADATVVLSRTVRVGSSKSGHKTRLSQQLRKWQPVDAWKIAADWQPLERKAADSFERQAPDPQLRYRPGSVSLSILAHGMREGGSGLAERLLLMSRWFAQRHFEVVKYPVQAIRPGLDLWPGTVVRLTDPELVDPSTGYEVENRIAIVTGTSRTFGRDELAMTVDLLVLGTSTSDPRVFAPLARGRGYNTATNRLYLHDDYFGAGNGWSDATHFDEDALAHVTALGGNPVIECRQWDGDTMAVTLTGTVISVSTAVGDAYLVLTSTSGTYYRDMDTWVGYRPSTTANAAWVEARHSPIADETGEWTDDAAAAQDVYTWEA